MGAFSETEEAQSEAKCEQIADLVIAERSKPDKRKRQSEKDFINLSSSGGVLAQFGRMSVNLCFLLLHKGL